MSERNKLIKLIMAWLKECGVSEDMIADEPKVLADKLIASEKRLLDEIEKPLNRIFTEHSLGTNYEIDTLKSIIHRHREALK